MKFLILLLVTVIILFAGTRYLERRSIYFPTREISSTPGDIELPFEDINFESLDGTPLHGWFIGSGWANTILFCHGNGGNISHRIEKARLFKNAGFDVFMFDYRGYGRSGGSPSELGLYQDVQAAYDYLVNQRNKGADTIVVYGESLGGAVAIHLASRKPVAALVVEDTFTSIRDMAKSIYPMIPRIFIQTQYDSISKIEHIPCAKLFFHSVDDEIIPYAMGQALFERAVEPKEFVSLRGAHNSAFWDSGKVWYNPIRELSESL